MKKGQLLAWACLAGVVAVAVPARGGGPVWHDPWLNWDFINFNPIGPTVNINDFAVIVDNPSFNPDPNKEQWAVPFPTFNVFNADYDGDGDTDTMCKWSGAWVAPNQIAHGGLYMPGSGFVLDAYFTLNCNKVYISTPVTYEMTRIEADPEVHMELWIAPGYYKDPNHPDYPSQEAGWTNIRTFRDIPAEMLELGDLNRDLDLDDPNLAMYEVTPQYGKDYGGHTAGTPILPTDVVLFEFDPDPEAYVESFFDVFLGEVDPNHASPAYESLLVADVVNQGQVVGMFWNLNPQSPEPGTLALLGVGAVIVLRRRRSR